MPWYEVIAIKKEQKMILYSSHFEKRFLEEQDYKDQHKEYLICLLINLRICIVKVRFVDKWLKVKWLT